jgi:hypothetical protein
MQTIFRTLVHSFDAKITITLWANHKKVYFSNLK